MTANGGVLLIAEVGANHAGRIDLARRLVEVAATAGADAVKFQLYTPAEMTADSAHPAYVLTDGPWRGERLWDLYERAHTPREWLRELFALARDVGVEPFASAFSPAGVEFLEGLGVRWHKIASAELACHDLVRAVAMTGKQTFWSDGLARERDLEHAEEVLGERGVRLACVSAYPAALPDYGLQRFRAMAAWARAQGRRWGLSDHTLGPVAAALAVAAGAGVVEKHIRLPMHAYVTPQGVAQPADYAHALNPEDFARFVAAVRDVAAAARDRRVADGRACMRPTVAWERRWVWAVDLPAGRAVGSGDVRLLRAGAGMAAGERFWDGGVQHRTAHAVRAGDPVFAADLVAEAP